jgi:hypothetical protein
MPRTLPDLPATLYTEIVGVGADGKGRPLAHLALLAPGEGLTENAVLEIAHRFVLARARLADRGGQPIGEVVESALVPPGGLQWHGRQVPEGTWLVAVRVDEEVAHALKSARRMILHPVEGATKRGDDVDRQTLQQVLRAALRPVVEAVGEVEVRLKRVEQRLAADPFDDALRGRGDAGTRELQRLKSLLRRVDPVGAAITERRPPGVSGHPVLDALAQEEDASPLDPTDPFADAVTRPRPPRRRPLGVSGRPKR